MKKGCILRLIFIATIVTAVALYLLQQKFGSLINLPQKEFVLPFTKTDLNKKLDFVKDSPEKINFEKIIEDAKTGIDFIKDLPSDQINNLSETFDNIFSDSIITEKELNYVRELFKKFKK